MNGFLDAFLTDADLTALDGLPDSVRHLDLRGHPISDVGLDRLGRFGFAASLGSLWLNSPKLTDGGLAALERCRELTHLQLCNYQITGAGFKHLRSLSKLETLDVDFAPVRNESLAHLVGLNLRKL